MTEEKPKFTPWTIPQSDWTPILEGVVVDENVKKELQDIVRNFDRSQLDKRLQSYEVKISDETMSKTIK